MINSLIVKFPIFFSRDLSLSLYLYVNFYSQNIWGIYLWAYQLVFSFLLLFADSFAERSDPFSFSRSIADVSLFLSRFLSPSFLSVRRSFCKPAGRPKESSNIALSSLSIRADSVELPWSKVRASNEAINKSTALTGLSTLFVRDATCPSSSSFLASRTRGRVHISSILVGSSSLTPRAFRWLDCRRLNRAFPRFFV